MHYKICPNCETANDADAETCEVCDRNFVEMERYLAEKEGCLINRETTEKMLPLFGAINTSRETVSQPIVKSPFDLITRLQDDGYVIAELKIGDFPFMRYRLETVERYTFHFTIRTVDGEKQYFPYDVPIVFVEGVGITKPKFVCSHKAECQEVKEKIRQAEVVRFELATDRAALLMTFSEDKAPSKWHILLSLGLIAAIHYFVCLPQKRRLKRLESELLSIDTALMAYGKELRDLKRWYECPCE